MIDFDQLKRDREAGTPGPWVYDEAASWAGFWGVVPGAPNALILHYTNRDDGIHGSDSDVRRISRVPDLEALALAGRELAAAAEDMEAVAEYDMDYSGNGWVGMPYGEFKALKDALAAWDKAEKGETND